MIGWHSASWSRGKEPRAGGLGRPILTPVPGAPKVDISFVSGFGFDLRYWVAICLVGWDDMEVVVELLCCGV